MGMNQIVLTVEVVKPLLSTLLILGSLMNIRSICVLIVPDNSNKIVLPKSIYSRLETARQTRFLLILLKNC